MKKNFLTPIAAWAVVGLTMFSCAGSNDVSDSTALEPTRVVVTETDVATADTPNGTVIATGTEVVADTTMMTPARDQMANTSIDYGDMFEDIADTEQYNVLDLAKTNPNLSTFVELVELSGLAPSMGTAENVTLFAPINAAFNQMPSEKLARLVDPQNRTELIEFVKMHTLPNEVSTAQLSESNFIDRGEEEDIPVSVDMGGTQFYVGGALIINSNVEASNGIVHVVNGVLETTDEAGADID